MAEGRPRLVAVHEAPERGPGEGTRRGRRHHVPWLLALALGLSVLGWGLARHEATALSRELQAARAVLAEAQAHLAAAEAQRAQVHTQVEAIRSEATALAGRLGQLEALLASDLEPADDAQQSGRENERAD